MTALANMLCSTIFSALGQQEVPFADRLVLILTSPIRVANPFVGAMKYHNEYNENAARELFWAF